MSATKQNLLQIQSCSTQKVQVQIQITKLEHWKNLDLTIMQIPSEIFPPLKRINASKGPIISKRLLVSSNSPKKWTNKFVFTTTTNLFICFSREFEDTKKSFRNYLTFSWLTKILNSNRSVRYVVVQSYRALKYIVWIKSQSCCHLFSKI